jgi:hypothetical protein
LSSNELSYDGGLGAHLRLTENIFLEPGVHYSGSQTVESTETGSGLSQHHVHYLVGAGLRLGNKLDVLAAGGVRHTIDGSDVGAVTPEARLGLAFF